MSRIGRAPIPVPDKVTVTVKGKTVTVKGPRGELQRVLPDGITVAVEDGEIIVRRANDERHQRALHGLTRALINNMVVGVTDGHRRALLVTGIGYKAEQLGPAVNLQVGYSHPVRIYPDDGIELSVETPNRLVVSGADKELVGDMAARIRSVRRVKPYIFRGDFQGIRYDDERPRRKAGKQGA